MTSSDDGEALSSHATLSAAVPPLSTDEIGTREHESPGFTAHVRGDNGACGCLATEPAAAVTDSVVVRRPVAAS